MKKIIVIIFLFVAVTLSAQDIPDDDTTSKPAITAIGKPDGAKAEMKIGKNGGSFTSADGKVKLIIPEGAVSKKTTFSIAPVTNLMPNGNGKAYRLEPSGIQFQKPVQLLFQYDPEEPEDSTELEMGIAMQDDKGQWYGLNEVTVDTAAKTIGGNINHFSTWASFEWLQIIAPERLKVRKGTLLQISGVDITDSDDEEAIRYLDAQPIFMTRLRIWKPPHTAIWRVNGIIKGNAAVGTLGRGKVDEDLAKNNRYVAPDNVPDQNPVTISVELVGAVFKRPKGKIQNNPRLKTKILIYDDAYEVTITQQVNGYAGSVFGRSTYKDEGSFVVELSGKKTKIIEKKNKNMIAEADYNGRCIITKLKPGYGSIHIVGGETIRVTPAISSQPAYVEIIFKRLPVMYPLLEAKCPNMANGFTVTTNAKPNAMAAQWSGTLPMTVKFYAKEGSQILEEYGNQGSDIYYRVEVRRLPDDD